MSAIGVGDLVVSLVTRGEQDGCRATEAGLVYRCRTLLDLSAVRLFGRFGGYQCMTCGDGDQVGVSLEGDPGADELMTGRAFWCSNCELRPVSGEERDKIEKLRELDKPVQGFEEPKRAPKVRASKPKVGV